MAAKEGPFGDSFGAACGCSDLATRTSVCAVASFETGTKIAPLEGLVFMDESVGVLESSVGGIYSARASHPPLPLGKRDRLRLDGDVIELLSGVGSTRLLLE